MNKILRSISTLYHLLFNSSTASCRFTPTCSQYFLDATDKYGVVKGMRLSIKRILACHPLSTRPLYDPA